MTPDSGPIPHGLMTVTATGLRYWAIAMLAMVLLSWGFWIGAVALSGDGGADSIALLAAGSTALWFSRKHIRAPSDNLTVSRTLALFGLATCIAGGVWDFISSGHAYLPGGFGFGAAVSVIAVLASIRPRLLDAMVMVLAVSAYWLVAATMLISWIGPGYLMGIFFLPAAPAFHPGLRVSNSSGHNTSGHAETQIRKILSDRRT
jgi:hypothetical protein